MAINKKINPLSVVLLLFISAGLGYAAYTFAQKQALSSTAAKTTNVVNTVVDEIKNQVLQWQAHASSAADVPSKQFFRTMLTLQDNNIENINNYSFGEQALLTKAQTSDEAVSDFVIASKDVPKHILGLQKYVYTTAVKQSADQIMLTRVAIQPLASILNAAAAENISLRMAAANQSKAALLEAGKAFERKGHVKSLEMAAGWQVSSSYGIANKVLSPKVLGILAAGIAFLLGLIPILFFGIKRAKAAQALELEEQRKQAKRKNKANSNAHLVKTEGLPLKPLAEEESSTLGSTNDATVSLDAVFTDQAEQPNTDNTPSDTPSEDPESLSAENEPQSHAPAFDTVAAVSDADHDIQPMLDEELAFSDTSLTSSSTAANNTATNNTATEAADITDEFADLESEIKSDEAEIAKYRVGGMTASDMPIVPDTTDDTAQDNKTNNQTMEFMAVLPTETASQVVDPKGQLAADELDDGNVIDFAVPDMSFTDDDASTSASSDDDNAQAIDTDNLTDKNTSKSADTRFRVHDVRANAALLDADFIKRFAYGYKTMLTEAGETAVIVGKDVRASSESIADILVAALTNLGVQVTDIGTVTTPMLAFACQQAHGNGIMVTASHCSAQSNGFKWYIKKLSPSPAQVLALADTASSATNELTSSLSTAANDKLLQKSTVAAAYKGAIAQDIMLADVPTVCIDCMHGAASMLAPSIIESAGTVVIPYHFNTDGNFSTGNPDPTEAGRLAFLSQKVLENHANIGFAFDGDADRLAVVDDKGRVVSSENLLCLFAAFILETNQSESIMLDAKYSRIVTDTISNAGGVPVMLPTGSSQMRNLLHTKQQTSVFAGEFSGHFIFNDKRFICHDDAVYAALRLLEYLTQSDKPLSAHVDMLASYMGTHDVYIDMPSQAAARQLIVHITEEWQKQSQHQPTLKQNYTPNHIDGFRLDSQSGFGIIRASNTVNAVSLRLAATDQQSFDSIKQVFTTLVLAFNAQVAEEINSLSIVNEQVMNA